MDAKLPVVTTKRRHFKTFKMSTELNSKESKKLEKSE